MRSHHGNKEPDPATSGPWTSVKRQALSWVAQLHSRCGFYAMGMSALIIRHAEYIRNPISPDRCTRAANRYRHAAPLGNDERPNWRLSKAYGIVTSRRHARTLASQPEEGPRSNSPNASSDPASAEAVCAIRAVPGSSPAGRRQGLTRQPARTDGKIGWASPAPTAPARSVPAIPRGEPHCAAAATSHCFQLSNEPRSGQRLSRFVNIRNTAPFLVQIGVIRFLRDPIKSLYRMSVIHTIIQRMHYCRLPSGSYLCPMSAASASSRLSRKRRLDLQRDRPYPTMTTSDREPPPSCRVFNAFPTSGFM